MQVNNQGGKEKTFIQTGRRGGDGQLERRECTAWQQLKDQADEAAATRGQVASHLHMDKPGGTTGSETVRAIQGSSAGK